MKLLAVTFNMLLLIFCMPTPACCSVRCIVIDAGHGGKDPGAVSGKLIEKNIVLNVALRLGELIGEQYPDIRVVYTRNDDRFVELAQRSDIANRADADLFISIHTNASRNTSAYGTETFVMGVDKSNANLEVAMRENNVITFENDYSSRYEGYDPSSSESFIIFSLMQYAYLTRSLRLASLVQDQYTDTDKRQNRGVKQAGFLVLWRTAMPSILSEIGFISNADEARYIASDAGQKAIAQSLLRAVKNYIESDGGNTGETVIAARRDPPVPQTEPDETEEQPGNTPRGIYFRMQVKSSSKKIPVTYENFGVYVTAIEEVKTGDTYKYYCGRVESYKDALILQQKVRKKFSDAFCVAFDGKQQIAVDKAKKLQP